MQEQKLSNLVPALTMEFYSKTAQLHFLNHLLNPSESECLAKMKNDIDLAMILWPQASKSTLTIYIAMEMLLLQCVYLFHNAEKKNEREEIDKYKVYLEKIADGWLTFRCSYPMGKGLMHFALVSCFIRVHSAGIYFLR